MPANPPFAEIDSVLRIVDREIWVVTASAGSTCGGLVATWVSQVSLAAETPVMLIGLAPNHFTSELIDKSQHFGLHMFTVDQAKHVLPFAIGSGRDRDKLATVDHRMTESGSPIINDCAAWLDCQVFHSQSCGDRVFYWADVIDGKRNSNETILRERDLIAACSETELASLRKNREEDVAALEPARIAWRDQLAK